MAVYQSNRARIKKKYYDKTATYSKIPWTLAEDAMVLEHSMTDAELSKRIGHSVMAIQIRRSRLSGGE